MAPITSAADAVATEVLPLWTALHLQVAAHARCECLLAGCMRHSNMSHRIDDNHLHPAASLFDYQSQLDCCSARRICGNCPAKLAVRTALKMQLSAAQAINRAVAPEVDSASASVAEVVAAIAGLGAAGVVAWSLATLKDTGAVILASTCRRTVSSSNSLAPCFCSCLAAVAGACLVVLPTSLPIAPWPRMHAQQGCFAVRSPKYLPSRRSLHGPQH